MPAYYNEFDPYAAQWLRNLIVGGLIAPGDVDDRSIIDVKSTDLKGYTQCHFFAGIAGWSLALRLAGWDDARPVWTGSCPCQPFSSAGKQEGHADERHLWPHWFRLIGECEPATIFGEQVASAITFGWMDEVAHDLEGKNYSFAAAVLPACSVGAPHRRDRLWFLANAGSQHRGREQQFHIGEGKGPRNESCGSGRGGAMADADGERQQQSQGTIGEIRGRPSDDCKSSTMAYTTSAGSFPAAQSGLHCEQESAGARHVESKRYDSSIMADTSSGGQRELRGTPREGGQPDSSNSTMANASSRRCSESQNGKNEQQGGNEIIRPSIMGDPEFSGLERHTGNGENFWRSNSYGSATETDTAWAVCPDGKSRPVKSDIRFLAHGVPARVGKIRAYGNAIVPQVASEVIKAFMEVLP